MAKLSDTARNTIAIMRARASISGKSKGKKKGGRRRSGGGGGGGFFGAKSLGGVSLFEAGSIAVIGGVGLGAFFKLPAWLSPIGAALFLYGMWRKNALLKALGLLLVSLGVVEVLGIPSVISAKIQEAKAKGILPMLNAGAGAGATAPSNASNNGATGGAQRTGTNLLNQADRVAEVATNVVNLYDRVGASLA